MSNIFDEHILNMLKLGKAIINSSPRLVEETGNINTKGDKTIGMDIKIEEALIDYVKKNNLPVKIYSEEVGILDVHANPSYYLSFDPLDGSTNYKIGQNLRPYGLLITVYQGTTPKIKDIVVAGAIEYTKDLAWIYSDGVTKDLHGNPIKIKSDWDVEQSTPVELDIFREARYLLYAPISKVLSVRNTCATIGNLEFVLTGGSAGMGHANIKAEEVGAVYALIKGAGGVVVDHNGNDLGDQDFAYNQQYQLLGGDPNIVKIMADLIKDSAK